MLIFNLSSEKAIEIADEAMRSARILLEHKITEGSLERTGHAIHLLGLSLKELGHDYNFIELPDLVRRLEEAIALLLEISQVRVSS